MINAIKSAAGVEGGKIILRFLGDDEKRYDVALTPLTASQVIAALAQALEKVPLDEKATVAAVSMKGGVTLAMGERGPALLLESGALKMAFDLTASALRSLRDDMTRYLDESRH